MAEESFKGAYTRLVSDSADKKQHLELEIRFGEFRGNQFVAGITAGQFQNLKEHYILSEKNLKIGKILTIKNSQNYIKNIYIEPLPKKVEFMRKTTIENVNLVDFSLRLSLSREEPITSSVIK